MEMIEEERGSATAFLAVLFFIILLLLALDKMGYIDLVGWVEFFTGG